MRYFPPSQWISVDSAVARSVNLERDATDKYLLKRFQVTPTALDKLYRLADALEGESVRAWSLTGPYGTGKSAFCNFLIALSCSDQEIRSICFKKLEAASQNLANRLKAFMSPDSKDALAIGVRTVSRYESLNSTLARGLSSAVSSKIISSADKRWEKFKDRVNSLTQMAWPPTRDIVDAFVDLTAISGKKVFLVVDEFGKNLEYQAHHAEKGDIFALQALSETKGIFLWVCLHQSFSSYSGALSRVQRLEWQKIQGRFEDLPYMEPPIRSFKLISEVLSIKPIDGAHNKELEVWANAMTDAIKDIKLEGLPQLNMEEVKALYPFHPLAVYFIGEMTRRFGQNDRTVFSFLSSGEPHAFSSCLKRLTYSANNLLPTLGLDMLYDYFSETGVLRNSDRFENQRWIEIHAMIASHGGIGEDKIKLLKTIGVLNLLSSLPGVLASEEIIHSSLATSFYGNKRKITQMLQELCVGKILLYRDYAREYRLWEGSDFDLDSEVLQARGRVAFRPISQMLEDIASRPNMVAARHSVQTGTIRDFIVKWCTEEDVPEITTQPYAEEYADGCVWLMIGRQKNPEGLTEIAKPGTPVIVGYSSCLDQVRQLLLEAAATREACNAPQLERDGVARREARYRASQSLQYLLSFIDDAFAPGKGKVKWFAEGEYKSINSRRALSALASDLCDRIYQKCPHINNEMINANRISGIAAAARNRVGEGLANQSMTEDLGFCGFGPEVAVYRTVFKNTALHRKNADGEWILSPPDMKDQPQLAAVWEAVSKMLSDADSAGRAVPVKEIIDTLKRPPFGLREGPSPLLLCHYLLVHADEVAVYEDNVFKPFFGDAETTMLMRRPEIFSLRSYQPTGIRSEVIRTYYQVINTELKLAHHVRNKTLLSVVVPLTDFIKSLPEYTRATRSISANALRLRNAIANANDPQEMLFKDIPKALGFPPVETDVYIEAESADNAHLRKALWEGLVELRDAFDNFVSNLRRRFLLAISDPGTEITSFENLRAALKKKADPLINICMDRDLKPALAVLSLQKETDDEWLMRLAAIIMKKPVITWHDTDIEPFAIRIETLRQRLGQLHALKREADQKGRIDHKSRFIGVVLPDGNLIGKTVTVSAKYANKIQHVLKMFENEKEARDALLASLIETMENKGDFH